MIGLFKINNPLLFRSTLAVLIELTVCFCFAQPAIPHVSIEIINIDEAQHVKLNWESLEGAESYNIYVSPNPYKRNWGEPVFTVGDTITEYTIEETINELGNQNYFQVTSHIPPQGMTLVDGDLFGDNQVAIDPFYISKYEVTQAEFASLMGEWDFHFGDNPNHPAETVSWFDAIEYCNRLSLHEGLTPVYTFHGRSAPDDWHVNYPGWNENRLNHAYISCNWETNGYRLPTEAEWHHAANGGIHSPPYTYSGSENINEIAWYSGNSQGTTHPVGTKVPNNLGIYDMSGNVYEWCWDIWSGNWPPEADNYRGPTVGNRCIYRGGGWNSQAYLCALTVRSTYMAEEFRFNYLGFRVCRVLE